MLSINRQEKSPKLENLGFLYNRNTKKINYLIAELYTEFITFNYYFVGSMLYVINH
jgi:hypothetical protein